MTEDREKKNYQIQALPFCPVRKRYTFLSSESTATKYCNSIISPENQALNKVDSEI